ncbi:MAG: branched-chain-amino-acid transaminase [Pseudomonadales bacterium]
MATFNIDGKLVPESEATVSVMDHGLLYGDGVFEGLRFYNGEVFREHEHLLRLEASAKAIGLTLPMDFTHMSRAMAETITASGQSDGYIRLLVTRGVGPLGIDASSCGSPKTIIIIDQLALVPRENVQTGIKVIIAKTRRISANQLDPRIKSLNYLNNIQARREATAAGAEEAIMLNSQDRVAEGSADNVFIVQNGKLITPLCSEGALEGITRQVILELAATCNIEAIETTVTKEQLITADECFLTGTGAELIPVRQIDDTTLPERRPVFSILSQAFTTMVAELGNKQSKRRTA